MANQYVRRAKKEIKKTHPVTVLIALVIFILGFAGGGLASYKICEGDGFSLKGEKNITLALGERYEEAGFTAVSFGRDISARVLVDDSAVDYTAAGEYYIVYRIEEDIKFGGCQLVRYLTLTEAENG